MPTLNLKPTHKPIKAYYAALDRFARLGVTHETAVRAAFQTLLETCARQAGWTLVPEFALNTRRNKRIVVDGALIDDFQLAHGYWEAKDIDDDLPTKSSASSRPATRATTSSSRRRNAPSSGSTSAWRWTPT